MSTLRVWLEEASSKTQTFSTPYPNGVSVGIAGRADSILVLFYSTLHDLHALKVLVCVKGSAHKEADVSTV